MINYTFVPSDLNNDRLDMSLTSRDAAFQSSNFCA